MEQFKIPCSFDGATAPFPIWIGEPAPGAHPLGVQAAWLRTERRGEIAQEILDSFSKLRDIATENNVSFEELCVYAMGEAGKEALEADAESRPEGVAEEVEAVNIQEVVAAPPPDVVAPGPGEIVWDAEAASHRWYDEEAGTWLRWDRPLQAWVAVS